MILDMQVVLSHQLANHICFLQLFLDLNIIASILILYLGKAVRYTTPYSRGQALDMKPWGTLSNCVLPLTLKQTS